MLCCIPLKYRCSNQEEQPHKTHTSSTAAAEGGANSKSSELELMDLQGSLSRMFMRRKYMRVDQGSPKFVVKRKRVKVAHLHAWVPARPLYKLKIKLRGFSLHLGSPANLLARVMKKLHLNGMMPNPTKFPSGKGKRNDPDTRRITFPKRTIRSSTNEVVDEAWFRFALNRAIAEGKLLL